MFQDDQELYPCMSDCLQDGRRLLYPIGIIVKITYIASVNARVANVIRRMFCTIIVSDISKICHQKAQIQTILESKHMICRSLTAPLQYSLILPDGVLTITDILFRLLQTDVGSKN